MRSAIVRLLANARKQLNTYFEISVRKRPKFLVGISPCESIFLLFAQIAQLVEQRTENPRVTGSIPVLGTEIRHLFDGFFYFIP